MKNPHSVYINFFKKTSKERIIFLRGGRRSGKTYAILFKLLKISLVGSGGDVLITSNTHANLGKIMKDFADVFLFEPEYRQKFGEYYAAPVGYRCTFRFRSFNTPQDAKGTKCKFLYINEADGLEENIYNTLKLGVEKQIICDHNPTSKFWGTELQNENNTLVTSFEHNSFLSEEQKAEFYEILKKGKNAAVGSIEYVRYCIQILGEYSEFGGQIFNKVFHISEDEFEAIEAVKYCGVDWGDTTDATSAVLVKFDIENKKIYIKEAFYSVFVPDSHLADKILSIPNIHNLIYETATGGNTRILNLLQNKEFNRKIRVTPVVKQSVYSSVSEMAEWTIYVCGKNAQIEFANYKVLDGKFTGEDHIIDAARYVFIMVVLLKIVR